MAREFRIDAAGRLKLLEGDVVRQVTEFLENERWIVKKTGYGEVWRSGRAVGRYGEKGQSDTQCVRYLGAFSAQIFYIEFKRPKSKGDSGGKLRPRQREWLDLERSRGAVCIVVDDLEKFKDWYRKENL